MYRGDCYRAASPEVTMVSSTQVLQPGEEVSAAPFSLAGHRDRGPSQPGSKQGRRVADLLAEL